MENCFWFHQVENILAGCWLDIGDNTHQKLHMNFTYSWHNFGYKVVYVT
jgi:hypothetical protein